MRGVSSTGEALSDTQQESKMLDMFSSSFAADKSEAKNTGLANDNSSPTYGNSGPENSDAKAEAKDATAAVGNSDGGDEKKSTGAVDVATVLV